MALDGTASAATHSATRQLFPFIICQFAIEGHPRRTEHWNFIVVQPNDQALVFELAGNIDTYTFVKKNMPFSWETHNYRGAYLLCEISEDKLVLVEDILSKVSVVRNSIEHDCQTWAILGLRKLQDEGLVARDVTEKIIRRELGREIERWEGADDTLMERLQY